MVTASDPTPDPIGKGPLLPAVGIVVPTHHRPDMLSRLLESFRHLTYPCDRLALVVVGGATDPGRDVVRAFAEHANFPVAYCVVPENALRSVSLKRNAGTKSARGDILAFVDDDCVAHPRWISAAVPFFTDPRVGGVEGLIDVPRPPEPSPTYKGSLRLSMSGGYRTGNIFYRRSVFEECGGFDESLPYLEDTDLGYTVKERGYAIPFVEDAAVSHPVQPGQPLKGLAMTKGVKEMPYLFDKHAKSKPELRTCISPLNRSHYVYLAIYGTALALAPMRPVAALMALGVAFCVVLPLHIAHDFWGLHYSVGEVALTALFQPIIPILRLYYWVRGVLELRLGLRRYDDVARR